MAYRPKPRGLVTQGPKAVFCRRCGRIVLDGLDDGVPYRLDPLPVTIAAERVARTARRYSFSVIDGSPRLRDLHRVRMDLNTRPVLLEHSCEPLDATTVDARFIQSIKGVTAGAVPSDAEHDALLLLRSVLGARVYADAPPF